MTDLYNYIDECEKGLHSSEFAIRLVELNKVRNILRDVISSWQFASRDFCHALDEENIFAEELREQGITGPSELLSHIRIVDQEIMAIDDMLCSYIEKYFKAGIVIEEKISAGISVTKEEYDNFKKIKNNNPIKDEFMTNALSFINTKCYIDILKTLTSGNDFSILDQVNQILDMVGAEFKTYFMINTNSYDKLYLKYSLVEVDNRGISHILYDPTERIACSQGNKTRNKRLLNKRTTYEVSPLEDSSYSK